MTPIQYPTAAETITVLFLEYGRCGVVDIQERMACMELRLQRVQGSNPNLSDNLGEE